MRAPHGLLVLALVAVGCGAKTLPDRNPIDVSPLSMGQGEWRVVDQVFVVTDSSGTMYMEETFPEAKALSRSFIKAMPERSVRAKNEGVYQASAIGFGGEDRVVAPLARFDRGALDAKAREFQIMGSVDGRGGLTPYRKVFAEIEDALEGTRGKAAVVIFSDGLPDQPDQALAAARSLAESHRDGVCFHAVQTGGDSEGTEFLGKLVRLTNCGSFARSANVQTASAFLGFTRGVFTGQAPPPPPVAAAPPGCAGIVRLRGVEFGFDRAEITGDSAVVLNVAIDQLHDCPGMNVSVDGHTDSIGAEDYNQGLSERRAGAVQEFFERSGIDSDRLQGRGFGESRPIAPNDNPDGRARNRRVELIPAQ